MDQMLIDDIYMSIEKKRIKNMYIRVTPPFGNVKLTAPLGTSDRIIYGFAASRLEWVKERRLIYLSKVPDSFVTGEIHQLWGKPYELNVYENNEEVIAKHKKGFCVLGEGEISLFIPKGSSKEHREALLNELYRKELKSELPDVIEKCEQIIGVHSSEWTIRNMKTRWGTCNVKTAKICFNLQLAKKPITCLEYIAIHELAHLLERGHGPRFKAYMDMFCPEWKNQKKILNGLV